MKFFEHWLVQSIVYIFLCIPLSFLAFGSYMNLTYEWFIRVHFPSLPPMGVVPFVGISMFLSAFQVPRQISKALYRKEATPDMPNAWKVLFTLLVTYGLLYSLAWVLHQYL